MNMKQLLVLTMLVAQTQCTFGMEKKAAGAASAAKEAPARPSLFEQFQNTIVPLGFSGKTEFKDLVRQKDIDPLVGTVVEALDAYDATANKETADRLNAALNALMETLTRYTLKAVGGSVRPGDEPDDMFPQYAPAARKLLTQVKIFHESLDFDEVKLSEGTRRLLKRIKTGDRT